VVRPLPLSASTLAPTSSSNTPPASSSQLVDGIPPTHGTEYQRTPRTSAATVPPGSGASFASPRVRKTGPESIPITRWVTIRAAEVPGSWARNVTTSPTAIRSTGTGRTTTTVPTGSVG
jgi:hypothetical protein